jgi:Mn-containing catalase
MEKFMFRHQKELQYHARPEKPDPLFAKQLQEVLGGQWGEMSVSLNYLFQGWNCRAPQKYRDMLMDIGTEEIGHCEMLATMIARLLETSPVETQEEAAKDSFVGTVLGGGKIEDAVLAGMNPQHVVVSGSGALPCDSMGFPWTSKYIIASGNLLADFRFNVTAESQGRLQVARLYALTDDPGVKDLLQFLLARDTMHQNLWLAAIRELEEDGFEEAVCPASMQDSERMKKYSHQYIRFSNGQESRMGGWAEGASPDGMGNFQCLDEPEVLGDIPKLSPVDPRLMVHPKPLRPLYPWPPNKNVNKPVLCAGLLFKE